ncbi:transmembrane protein 131-like isoform X2 [Conger conger]|uniref:transmembrane protein 131-like isoform X2 n=1 Tax=Conger conger TaxID=82655 RepID=UPI002A5A1DC5|nr:transmembrane protein 131-like isoform X2 [Conger conger]
MAGLRDFQQGGNCHRKTWINILIGILQLILTYAEQRGAQLQALSHMSGVVEVWQAEEAELLVPPLAEEDHSKEGLPQEESSSFYMGGSGRALHFKPPVLDFGTQLLGQPRAETIYIHNPSQEVAVTLLSVFTSSTHLHAPPFHKRVILPRGKASFKLIFLPTEEGNVETSLFINTSSHGLLPYQVFGVGVHTGAQTTSHMKTGVLLFPHIHSIKLTQTQEDASNITLLGLLLESRIPENAYRRSPHQGSCFATEKLAVQISLSERGERRTDLERLKPYVIENIMVLFVMSSGGSGLREPRIRMYMLNSGTEKLFVKDMQVLSDGESSLQFKQILLKASATNFTQVATLACRGSVPAPDTKCSTHTSLSILRNSTSRLHPALVLTHRGFGRDPSALFRVTPRHSGRHLVDLWLTSGFDFSFSVNEATVPRDMEGILTVTNFSRPVAVPWGCWRLLSLRVNHRKLPVNVMTTVVLVTSIGLSLEIPLRVRSGSKGDVVLEASAECGKPCPLRLSDAGRVQWQQTLLDVTSSWRVDSSLAAELCSRWRNNKDQLTCSWPRLPVETSSPLDFGATPVNERKMKYFQVKNPSGSPVYMEVRVLSSYSAPLDALDLLTKWFNISPLSVNITTGEFSLLHADGQESLDGGVRLLLLPQETKEVHVAFTPTEHRPVTSLILIRNNLTVFDMVMVRGHGARELLRIGGKLPGPGASLRFNVPQATLMECRDRLRSERSRLLIRKSFKVENAGELPLTVVSMTINGYKCQGFGFEVLQCRSFQLDHNSTSEINIAFVPDFTSSWVIRDLTLVTGRGSSFPFTLNVTLPHHMLPLCAQVVPGPNWEEAFWVITLVFACCSLGGVCFLAFHQAQYILSEFTAPSSRTNHGSALSRDNSPISPVCHNGLSKAKGSCKTFVDSCNSSDKGKGKGSLAVGCLPARNQPTSKKGSGSAGPAQKKHKVSLYYGKQKGGPSSPATASEEREEPAADQVTEPVPDAYDRNEDLPDLAAQPAAPANGKVHFPQTESRAPAPVMFPMETRLSLPDDVVVVPGRGADKAPPRFSDVKRLEKRDNNTALGSEVKDCDVLRLSETVEQGVLTNSQKGKKSAGKGQRRSGEDMPGVSEHSTALLPDRNRDQEWRENRTANRNRNRCSNGKPEVPKCAPNADSPVKQLQNGVCPSRPRRKGAGRPQWESGSDSGSSSGSVRASRGSWGSWSSASSLEGEKDPNTGARHHCTGPARPRDNIQYSVHQGERDCYQTLNSNYKAQSTHTLYRKDPGTPDPAPTSSFTPSFAAVAAGLERNNDITCTYLPEEAWSAPSVPLTNEFRYNTTESLPFAPQGPSSSSYNGFPWSSASSHCTSSYPYSEQSNYAAGGSTQFQNSLLCQETPNVTYSPQHSWGEDSAPEVPSVWDGTGCVGTKVTWGPPGQVPQRSPTLAPEARKGFFSGTRSLSPMSGLFGSIWTPQSEPYQNHFQRERSLPPSPQSPYSPERPGVCRPGSFSSFNPFGPHMNLDIWNSSSNRSSNSQLSNDSGYCGDV